MATYGVDEVVARRIFARVHREGGGDLDGVVGLSRPSRERLQRDARFPELEIIERRRAADGFVKYLFRLHDGHAIEAVRIPLPDPQDARDLKARRRAGLAAPLEALPTS